MRIIAGDLKGHNFEAPRGTKTHPMADKIRGALFNTLGDIEGLTVLDAFSGSGALALEAVSRGAAFATSIENDNSAQKVIESNINSLGLSQKVKLVKTGVGPWLETSKKESFDLVLADPPYDKVSDKLLIRLAERVKKGGVVILSLPPDIKFRLPENKYQILSEKSYGDAALFFYRPAL